MQPSTYLWPRSGSADWSGGSGSITRTLKLNCVSAAENWVLTLTLRRKRRSDRATVSNLHSTERQTESRCFTARSAQQAGYRTDCPLVVFSCSARDLIRICPQEFRGEDIKFSLIWVHWSCKWRSCIKVGWSTSVSSSFRFQPTRISSPLVHVLLPCNHVSLYLLQTAGSCSFVSLLLLKYVFFVSVVMIFLV